MPKVVESQLGDHDILPSRENALDSVGESPTYSTLRWWYLEIGCCFLAIASLVAQAIVLWQYDGKPQDAWPSTTLTLNGLIAILATVCRATFMIAVGAILSQAKWNHFSGGGKKSGYQRLDDFTLIDDASREPEIHLYYSSHGPNVFCLLREPLSPTKLAMYNGFMSTEVSLPQVTCPTGNCTWPIVPIVEVCGSCVALTSEIKINRISSASCLVTAPDGARLRGYCGSGSDFIPVFNISTGSNRTFESTDPRMIKGDAPNLIAQFSGLGISGGMPATTALDDSRAAECALWYCFQARNISVESGQLKDEILDIWSEVTGVSSADGRNVTFANIPVNFNTEVGKSYGTGPFQMYVMQGVHISVALCRWNACQFRGR
ncbi:hypothetical protein CSAL01_07954 [Colletotrichum salicis]|uniref:Uncharacterized protein n=1 Tax=Colletotrichum salicis TaxID=1209931 RepID=A0A135V2R6_9PEZI|nr:hypothetical protein CSAL01_07954 [Colletotrichum salicis]